MNTIYRIVWNAATGKWVVASELARGRKKKAARVAGFAAALALSLSFGSNVAMADTAAPGSSCTMPSGASGTLDESGFCMTNASGAMGLQSVGVMAAVDDARVKVNGSAAAIATGTNTIAIGSGAQSDAGTGGDGNIAIGNGATNQNTGAGAIVMGRNATIQGPGGNAAVTGAGSIAIGDGATVYGNNAMAIGGNTSVQGNGSIAIGDSSAATGVNAMAVGRSALAQADSSVALGSSSVADRANTVSVGSATATRQIVNVKAGTQVNDAATVGQLTPVVNALGGGASFNASTGAVTGPTYSVGGTTVTNVGDAVTNLDGRVTSNTTDITNLTNQVAEGTVGLVQQDAVSRNITIAAGTGGNVIDVTGTDGARKITGVANGELSDTSTDAVNGSQLNAINQQVTQNTTNISTLNSSVTSLDGRVTSNETNITNLQAQIGDGTVGLVQQDAASGNITVGAGTAGSSVNVAGASGPRVVSGVANGTDDTDAVTIAQLKAVGLVDASGNTVAAITYDDATLATARLGGSAGTVIDNLAAGRVAAGSMQAINGGQLYDVQQNFQSQFDSLNGQVGQLNDRVGVIEQGVGNPGNGGGYTPAPGTGDNSLAIGEGANASGSGSAAVGNGANASGDNSSAVGNGAVASGNNGTAVGANAGATADNAVALGAGSVADRANSVSVGSAGNERQITNVAAGTAATDAVNVQQLNDARDWAQSYTDTRANALDRKIDDVNRRANAGTAAAIAVANLPQAYAPGQSAVSGGVGTFNGQTAVAAGMTTISSSGRWVFRGSVVGNNRGDTGAGAGAAMVW